MPHLDVAGPAVKKTDWMRAPFKLMLANSQRLASHPRQPGLTPPALAACALYLTREGDTGVARTPHKRQGLPAPQ